MKPRMTGLWQVSGRSEVDFEEWIALDLRYIDNWSFWLDLKILLKTFPAVISGRGSAVTHGSETIPHALIRFANPIRLLAAVLPNDR